MNSYSYSAKLSNEKYISYSYLVLYFFVLFLEFLAIFLFLICCSRFLSCFLYGEQPKENILSEWQKKKQMIDGRFVCVTSQPNQTNNSEQTQKYSKKAKVSSFVSRIDIVFYYCWMCIQTHYYKSNEIIN